VLVVVGVWLFVAKASPRMPDFEVYWRAGGRAAAAEPLYRASDAEYQFKYFPAFAVIAIPLGLMPLDVAKALWFTLSVAALAALLSVTPAVLPFRRKPKWLLIAVTVVALGKYYAEDLVLGQINTLVACVVTCAIVALRRGHETLAGAAVAVAIVFKPYALILAPWIIARRRPGAIAALLGGLAVAWALPAMVYGFDGTIGLHREWWRTVTGTTAGILLHSDNVSLASMWAKWLGAGPLATTLASASSLALLAAAGVAFLRRNGVARPDGLEAGLLIAITPLISPQGWDYVVILATTALAYVVNDFDRLPRLLRVLTIAAIAVVGLSLYDVLGRELLYALLNLSVITIGMIVIIAALLTLRMRRLA
jgi:Glycosyltransferase family 87